MPDASLARQVVDQVKGRAQELANQIARNVGEPVDASKMNRAEVARLWNLQNPQANPMQVQQLIAQGRHSQALDLQYPWRNKLIGRGSPQQRVDRAAQLSKMASGEVTGDVQP